MNLKEEPGAALASSAFCDVGHVLDLPSHSCPWPCAPSATEELNRTLHLNSHTRLAATALGRAGLKLLCF